MPGVTWNSMTTSPIVIVCPVLVTMSVGAISEMTPREPRPEARRHLALGSARQRQAELIAGAAAHGGAGNDVLRDGVLHEAVRGDDPHLAGGHVLAGRDAEHAAIVVAVAVRIDDGDDRLGADMLVDEAKRGARDFDRGQRIDDDPARPRVDEADGRNVEAADLPDAVGDLEDRAW